MQFVQRVTSWTNFDQYLPVGILVEMFCCKSLSDIFNLGKFKGTTFPLELKIIKFDLFLFRSLFDWSQEEILLSSIFIFGIIHLGYYLRLKC